MFRFQTVAPLTLVLIAVACSSSRVSPTSAAPEIASVIAVRPLAEVHPVLGVDDRIHLAYELLVVNFSLVLVSLDRVESLSASIDGCLPPKNLGPSDYYPASHRDYAATSGSS